MKILLLLLPVLFLMGCPGMAKPDGCPPWAMRCGPHGEPQVCSGTQRWTPADRPCADNGAVCCRTTSPSDKILYACVPQTDCLPETDEDAGARDGE